MTFLKRSVLIRVYKGLTPQRMKGSMGFIQFGEEGVAWRAAEVKEDGGGRHSRLVKEGIND